MAVEKLTAIKLCTESECCRRELIVLVTLLRRRRAGEERRLRERRNHLSVFRCHSAFRKADG